MSQADMAILAVSKMPTICEYGGLRCAQRHPT